MSTVLLTNACGDGMTEIEPGVSLALAQSRAERLSELRYELRFEIPSRAETDISAQASVTFELADTDSPLQIDYAQPPNTLHSLRVNGAETEIDWRNEHIIISPVSLRRGQNHVEIAFTAGSGSLNRNPGFLYTLLVPDRARTVFPLFDQPDLKAVYRLVLVLPEAWIALANAPVDTVGSLDPGRQIWTFRDTTPISSYVFAFVAGEFKAVTRRIEGREMTMLHRETDAAKVARNLDAIFALHAESLAWMEEYTGIEYPFSKFDFVLIPGFPYGGMEHVGLIAYRASRLLLEHSPTLVEELNRAQLIAHETAHMWFGNLVTMRWFDDVWTKEVFANFIADKIVNPSFPDVDHRLSFLVSHAPAAYAVDRTQGANPIRQGLANLNQAGQLYGAIIYHKAPIMMQQLELLLGEEVLQEGLAEYLQEYAFANASWPELITILDRLTDVNLAAWSEIWVNSAGRPEIAIGSSAAERAAAGVLSASDPQGQGRAWPQQFSVLNLANTETQLIAVGNENASVLLDWDEPEANLNTFLLNADGRGYGLFAVSSRLFEDWHLLEPVAKGSLLINAYENTLNDPRADMLAYALELTRLVQREENPLLLQLALEQLASMQRQQLSHDQRERLTPKLEDVLWETGIAQADQGNKKLLFQYYSGIAESPQAIRKLEDIYTGSVVIEGLTLDENERIRLAEILAIHMPERAQAILNAQIDATQNPDSRRRLVFIAPSLSADATVRDKFFQSLSSTEMRATESWVIDALEHLHHPSRRETALHYVLPSLELLEEIQATGDIFFPSAWLQANLATHNSPDVALLVREFLQQRPDYNPQLRLKILQEADGLFRAAARQPFAAETP
ncbi:MAG: M1 family aminopeptidase [Pseudomonadota bacterium]